MKPDNAYNRTQPVFSAAVLFSALLISGGVQAGVASEPVQASHVEDAVTDQGGGTWLYEYTVFNDGSVGAGGGDFGGLEEIIFSETVEPIIRDWELPWFSDAGIANILSPSGWDFAIETIGVENAATGWDGIAHWQDPNDAFYAGDDSPFTTVTEVLHWYTNDPLEVGIFTDAFTPTNFLSGFSFEAAFDTTDSPYQASWVLLETQTGDPLFPLGVSGSPLTLGSTQPMPEPGTLALVGIGLLGWSMTARRKRQ